MKRQMTEQMKAEEDVKRRLRNANFMRRYEQQKREEQMKAAKKPDFTILLQNGTVIHPKSKARFEELKEKYFWRIKYTLEGQI